MPDPDRETTEVTRVLQQCDHTSQFLLHYDGTYHLQTSQTFVW